MDIDKIKSYCNRKNAYISFRDSVNVSLINPNNIYNTPTGVYTYPSIDFISKINECNNVQDFIDIFPYKGRFKPNYIYFYYLNNKSIILDNDSEFDDIEPFYRKLVHMFEGKSDHYDRIISKLIKYLDKDEEKLDVESGLFKFYDFYTSFIYDIRKDNKSEVQKLWTLTYHISDDNPTFWGNLLRKIGIDAFVDHGVGYIHDNEPSQAVLLNPGRTFEFIEIDNISSFKNDIKKSLEDNGYIDYEKLEKIFPKDPGFVFNIFLYKVKKGDYEIINNHVDFIIEHKDNRIITEVLNIFVNNLNKYEGIQRMNEKIINILMNKFGDLFFKNYIDSYLSIKEKITGLGEEEDLKRKLIIGSLFNVDKKKTVDFLNRNKQYDFNDEVNYLYDDPKLIKKHKSIHEYYFGGVNKMWDFLKKDDPKEKVNREELQHRYELFKDTYEKITGSAWTFEKFQERSKNWEFYGDYNGYIAVRPQASGYYKLVGSAGDYKSVMRGMNELIKLDKPTWGMMSEELSELLVKRYNFHKPPKYLFKYLFNLVKPKDFNGQILGDGGVLFNYEDTGETKKYFVANTKYFLELLNHDYFEKNKTLQNMLKFFIKRIK